MGAWMGFRGVRRSPRFIVVLAYGLSACADQVTFDPMASLALDGEVVVREVGGGLVEMSIPFRYTNGMTGVVVEGCSDEPRPSLLREVDDGWLSVWSPGGVLCTPTLLPMDPAEIYRATATARLDASLFPGRFRLIWNVFESYDPTATPPGTPIEESQRSSVPFDVDAPG